MLESPRMSDVSPYPPRQLIVLHYYANIFPLGPGESRGFSSPSFLPSEQANSADRLGGVVTQVRSLLLFCLDLLGTPAGVGLAHVGRGLDGRDELEDGVADTDQADDGAGNDAEDAAAEEDGSDENIDCFSARNAGQRGEQIRGRRE